MDQIYDFVNKNQDYFVKLLAESVAIKRCFNDYNSVSASAEMRPEVFKMGKWIESQLTRMNVSYELRELGKQNMEGKPVDLPPVILATYGTDPAKKTVLVYGHYDVQPGNTD
jgi:Cys-Gly metallodipeptidase DUG1